MSAKEMFEKVQALKEQVLLNGFNKTDAVNEFFNKIGYKYSICLMMHFMHI